MAGAVSQSVSQSVSQKILKSKLALSSLFLGSLFVFSPTYADLNTGLVANYSFDDCTAKDNSGNGHDGTINGNPQCVDGVKGKTLRFLNTSNSGWFDKKDWVVLPDYTGSEVSFYARVKWEAANNYDPTGAVWSIGDNSDLSHFLALFINSSNGDIWVQGQSKSVVSLSDGNWHTVAITASSSKTNFYFDNVLIESVSSTFVNFQDSPQYLAYHQWYNGGAGSSRFAGQIDETRIYNRALSETEIKSLYNMGQLSGTINGVQKYSAVCKNLKTGVSKKIPLADGAKEWNCNAAGLKAKKGENVTVTITGVSQ